MNAEYYIIFTQYLTWGKIHELTTMEALERHLELAFLNLALQMLCRILQSGHWRPSCFCDVIKNWFLQEAI